MTTFIIITLGVISLFLVFRVFFLQVKYDDIFEDNIALTKNNKELVNDMTNLWVEYTKLTNRFEDTAKAYSKIFNIFKDEIIERNISVEE